MPSQAREVTTPQLGVLTTRAVGDPLFEISHVSRRPGIELAPESRIDYGQGVKVHLPLRMSQAASTSGDKYCAPAEMWGKYSAEGILIPGYCLEVSLLDQKGISYRRVEVDVPDPHNLRQELLYQGRIGNELRLVYREYVNDLARPAFSQDLTFDLAAGKVVGAKGARLEVENASNVDITYRVLSTFSRP